MPTRRQLKRVRVLDAENVGAASVKLTDQSAWNTGDRVINSGGPEKLMRIPEIEHC